MKPAIKYCLIAAATAFSLLCGVAAFNTVVDPFGMYRLVEIRGFNSHKPAVYHRVRLSKAYDVRRIRPRAIVLGTSRSHLGLRPAHEGWDAAAVPRYNLAFDGATTKEMYHYLLHAHAMGRLRQVVLGLDTYHPTGAPASTRPDFDAQILAEPHSLISTARMIAADLRLLTSLDTLMASITTIRSQDDGEPEWFAPDGQRLGEVFFRRPGENFRKFGPRAYFEEIDRLEVGFKTEGRGPAPRKSAVAGPAPELSDNETSLGYIRRIVEFCRIEHIDLYIFITPEHAHQMEIAAAVGAWTAVENGKRALVRLLAEDAARHPGEPPIPLYDFSGYSSVTTEPLPDPGSREEMKFYWDSSHFKEVVGDYVFDRLFSVSRPGRMAPRDFGLRLTSDTVELTLERIRFDQAIYRKNNPDDIAVIRSLVDGGRQSKEGGGSLALAGNP